MPAILTDPAQLAAAHARFTQALQAALSQKIPCTIAAVNGGFDTEAAYSPEQAVACIAIRRVRGYATHPTCESRGTSKSTRRVCAVRTHAVA